jgi:hypothetical protein
VSCPARISASDASAKKALSDGLDLTIRASSISPSIASFSFCGMWPKGAKIAQRFSSPVISW